MKEIKNEEQSSKKNQFHACNDQVEIFRPVTK